MKTFIRIIEYWVPGEDPSLLEFGGGLFGDAVRFAAISQNLCFGRGEGLPGQAWESGHPIVLKDLEGSYFRRSRAAKAAGLTCGIAVPIFQAGVLSAVTVIFCGDDEEHAGAIELWHQDSHESKGMTLADGDDGATGDTFESMPHAPRVQRGAGLPGLAWERQTPVFLSDLGPESGFLRTGGAGKVGINHGFAIPCSSRDGSSYVLAFLWALATPIARRIEAWEPDASGAALRRSPVFAEGTASLSAPETLALSLPQAGPIVRAFTTGVPAVAEPMIAIPVAPQGRVTAVMALHF